MIQHRSRAKSVLVMSSFVGLIATQGCQSPRGSVAEMPLEIRADTTKEINLDEFRAQFATASRGPLHTHQRRAICSHPMPDSACVAKVTIQALGNSDNINPYKPIKEGRVIGIIRNLDPEDVTEMYSFKPASQAEYYIYIDNGPQGLPRWNHLEVPTSRSGRIRKTPRKNIYPCPHIPEHRYPSYSDVDFRRCGDHPLSSPAYKAGLIDVQGMRSLLLKLTSHFRPSPMVFEPGEWMYCPPGCCT